MPLSELRLHAGHDDDAGFYLRTNHGLEAARLRGPRRMGSRQKFAEICALTRSTFPEEKETNVAEALSSSGTDNPWQDMRTAAHDVLRSLGSACRRMIIFDDRKKVNQVSIFKEDDQLSSLGASFFSTVDGISK